MLICVRAASITTNCAASWILCTYWDCLWLWRVPWQSFRGDAAKKKKKVRPWHWWFFWCSRTSFQCLVDPSFSMCILWRICCLCLAVHPWRSMLTAAINYHSRFLTYSRLFSKALDVTTGITRATRAVLAALPIFGTGLWAQTSILKRALPRQANPNSRSA